MSTPQKIRCRVSKLINHGGHVFTVELIPDKPSPRFKAGQFLHLALDAYDPSGFWPESRVFSIASPPDSRDLLQITYSVKGNYTTRMENELAVGKEVWIKLPYGEFIIDPSRPVVLVAGGTGITAFTAFLEAVSENTSTPIHVFYGAREKDLLIFRKMLEEKQKSVQNLTIFYFIENLKQATVNEIKGQLSISAIWAKIDAPEQTDFYLSGPPLMLQKMTTELKARGMAANRIHVDAWE